MNIPTLPLLALIALGLLLRPVGYPAAAATRSPSNALPRATPESQGVDSSAILACVDALDRLEHVHSIMLLRHGRVIAEGWWRPYDAETRHELYSLSKSFASTGLGFAVAEGRVGIDDEVLGFFPEDAPAEPSANLRAMRVRDLLTMSTGHQDETSSDARVLSSKSFLGHPVPHKPGTHFRYNTPATFMLSAIVQKVTGQTLLDYLRPRLFEPLGIAAPLWNTNFQGISLGGYGLEVRTEDIARFGQFYLQEGSWQGRQLLPASWIREASARQVSNGSNPRSDWDQGYGYQFWRCRNRAYRGDGAFGQYCVVFPEQGAVLAITSGLRNMQQVLDIVWEELLPGFHARRRPGGSEVRRRLEARLASLSIPVLPATLPASGDGAAAVGKTFAFGSNDQGIEEVRLDADPSGKGWILVQKIGGTETRVPCGQGEWRTGRARFGSYPDEPVAACGAWTGTGTFTAKICARETPYLATLTLRFEANRVTRDLALNVSFGPTAFPRLEGTATHPKPGP